MPASLLCKILTGCVFSALWTTACLADSPAEASPNAAASGVGARSTAPAGVSQLGLPRQVSAVPAFQPVRTDSSENGVLFRPPKRPSQVKQLPVGPAELETTPDAESDEPAGNDSEPAPEAAPLAEQAEEQELSPRPLPPAAADSADSPKSADEPAVGTMSFNGVEPGQTTVAEMKQQWGEPAREATADGTTLYTFAMEPFKQVEATAHANLVTSVVVHLDPPMAPGVIANELRLRDFVPVPIPEANGQLLGQAYPERGVLFSFAANGDAAQVTQIVVEPISVEPFVLRALYDFQHRYSANLKDLDFALSQDENDAQAHWVKSRVLAEIGRYQEAVTEARAAVRLGPTVPAYRLELVRNLGLQGSYDEATELAEAIRAEQDVTACVKARAECELGRLLANRPSPDHKSAIAHFQEAVKLASPLVDVKQFEVRRAAKRILVDANAGIGLSVALGNYQRKSEVAAKWLDRAGAYCDQYVGGDNGPKHLPLEIAAQRLAAYAGMQEPVDPSQVADAAIQAGRHLISWSDDPLFEQQVEWLLGSALMDAVRVEHARGEQLQALRYAEMAVPLLESALIERQLAPAEQFAVGRFFFLAGAVEAVKNQDHAKAAAWYAKALPYLTSPAAQPADGPAAGRLGEWLVSMGVTFWEIGEKQKAVEMTELGADFVQQAVDRGIMKKSAAGVPYSNLATMHEALGNEDQASNFGRLAKAAEAAAAELKRR